jgi:hypothetical protein
VYLFKLTRRRNPVRTPQVDRWQVKDPLHKELHE